MNPNAIATSRYPRVTILLVVVQDVNWPKRRTVMHWFYSAVVPYPNNASLH